MGEDMFQCLISRTAFVFLAVVVLWLGLSCTDDDNPAGLLEPKEYYVYFNSQLGLY